MSQLNVGGRAARGLLKNWLISTRHMTGTQSMSPKYKPTKIEKKILVWTKKFKSLAEVPEYVTPDMIERARSQARIKISNILIVLTALASLGAILSGKAAAKRGESVHQQNLDWHKQYKEDFDKKEEALNKKS